MTECSKVAVTWQWANYLQATVQPGKQLLFINLDETYVAYYQGLFTGNMAVSKKQWPVTQRPLSQRASRGQLRMGLTHVGLICDEPLVQPLLPQVLIASESVLTMTVWRAVMPLLPSWMYLIRMPSKWITQDCMVWILNLIGWSLRAVAHLYDIVLSMDVLGLHYVPKVIAAARANGIRLHFIPGKLTWLLQPLDTHGFSLYKRYLKKIAAEFRAAHVDAQITVNQWLLFIRDTIDKILIQRNSTSAFRQNGFGDFQQSVSTFILRHLTHDLILPVSSDRPTDESLRCIFPKGRTTMDLSVFIIPPLAFPKVPPMLPPLPLPALAPPPPPIHLPAGAGGGGGVTAPRLLIFETPFLAARAKPGPPASIRSSPFVKWARPKVGPGARRVRVVSKASGSSASAAVPPVPKA